MVRRQAARRGEGRGAGSAARWIRGGQAVLGFQRRADRWIAVRGRRPVRRSGEAAVWPRGKRLAPPGRLQCDHPEWLRTRDVPKRVAPHAARTGSLNRPPEAAESTVREAVRRRSPCIRGTGGRTRLRVRVGVLRPGRRDDRGACRLSGQLAAGAEERLHRDVCGGAARRRRLRIHPGQGDAAAGHRAAISLRRNESRSVAHVRPDCN